MRVDVGNGEVGDREKVKRVSVTPVVSSKGKFLSRP